MKIVYVSGQCDFSALDMEESGELKSLVLKMLEDNITEIESEDKSTVGIMEAGEVDMDFVNFMRDKIVIYGLSKRSNFYSLEEILRYKH